MIPVKIKFESIEIKNIELEELNIVLNCVNESKESLRALGRNEEFSFEDIKQRYLESLISSLEFFCGIYFENKIIGIIKGRIENKPEKELLIQTIILFSEHRMKGIGSLVLREFEGYFRDSFSIDKYRAIVMYKNPSGQQFWSRNHYQLTRITQKLNEIIDEGMLILEKSAGKQSV